MSAEEVRQGPQDLQVDRVIYTTITLMSVLIVYDGWASLTFWGVVAVIVGPILCIFFGHVFGATLGTRVELGKPLSHRERRDVLVQESRYLLMVVPPLAILVVLRAAGMAYTQIIQVTVIVGTLLARLLGRDCRAASSIDRLGIGRLDRLWPGPRRFDPDPADPAPARPRHFEAVTPIAQMAARASGSYLIRGGGNVDERECRAPERQ